MKDLMMTFYNALINDPEIKQYVSKENIKFYDYPNANEIKDVVIVIDDLMSPLPSDYADNDNLTYEFLYQIDVFVKQNKNTNGRLLSSRLILRVQRILWEQFGFGEMSSNKPEYIKDFNIYRQSKTFNGKQYYKEMEQ
ncbi:hypothetical protein K4S27_11205 [Staphylococcus epidermidis]|nr:hypothetical protein [Staphylococcus epidermidis]MCG2360243.1 hypothetical protein [Staphylococcus epidermidis]MCG2367197.1 hypothetical protein [Staphylococcus epidermidis]